MNPNGVNVSNSIHRTERAVRATTHRLAPPKEQCIEFDTLRFMASITEQLAHARRRGDITAATVALASGLSTSNIYAIESGRRDPTASTLERAASGVGVRLLAVEMGGTALVADVVDVIALALTSSDEDVAYALFIELAKDMGTRAPTALVLSCFPAPSSIDAHWDAAVAGLVEWRLSERGLDAPQWARHVTSDRNTPWAPTSGTPVEAVDHELIPEQLLARGVWIEEPELTAW